MSRRILTFDHPGRFIIGTVGRPGERTFFLQVVDEGTPTTAVLEKEQASILAEKLVELLDQVRRSGVDLPQDPPDDAVDAEPLGQPIEPEFTVFALGLGWDPATDEVIVEAHAEHETDEVPDIGDNAADGPDTIRVRMTPLQALVFAVRTARVVAAGRPQCPFCHLPIDPDGHICPRSNGYRRSAG